MKKGKKKKREAELKRNADLRENRTPNRTIWNRARYQLRHRADFEFAKETTNV